MIEYNCGLSLSFMMDVDDGNEEIWMEAGYHDSDEESDSNSEREEIEEALYAHIFFESPIEEANDGPSDDENVKKVINIPVHHSKDNSLPGTGRNDNLETVSSSLEDSVDLQRCKSDKYSYNGFLIRKTIVPRKKSDVEILTSSNFDSPVNKQMHQAASKHDHQIEQSSTRTGTRMDSMDSSISEDSSADISDDVISVSSCSDDINLDEILSDMDGIDVNVDDSQRSLLKGYGNCHSSSDTDESVETTKPDISLGPKNRYFRIRPLRIQCYICRKIGHMSRDCPKPEKSQTCYLCGFTGHYAQTCPHCVCQNCNDLGHVAKLCLYPQQHKWKTCYRCNMYGHQRNKCSDIWRCYHMTTVPGKIVKKKKTVNKKIFCYNCGKAGHFGFECKERRMDRYSNPTYPFIVKYKLVHTETKEKHSQTRKHKLFDSDVEVPDKKTKNKYEKKKEISLLKQEDLTRKNQENIGVPTFVAYSKGLEMGNDRLKRELPCKDNNSYSTNADKQRSDKRNNNANLNNQQLGDDENCKPQIFDNVLWHKVSNHFDFCTVTREYEDRKMSKKRKKKKPEYSMDRIVLKGKKQKYNKTGKDPKTEKGRTNFEGPDENTGGYYQFNKGQMKKEKKERMNNFDKEHKGRHVAINARRRNGNWLSSCTDLRIRVMNPRTMEQHHQRSNKNEMKGINF